MPSVSNLDMVGAGRVQRIVKQKKHYLVLDGLRGVAAISVLGFHGRWWLPHLLSFSHGYLAVDFFFMLSGFVLGCAYEKKLTSRNLSLLQFVRLRVIRLYPLIILGALIGLTPFLWDTIQHKGYSLLQVLAFLPLAALAIPSWGKVHYPLNGPTWSLSCEIAINILFAATVRWLSTRVLLVVALTCLATETWLAVDLGTIGGIGAVYGPIWGVAARTAFPFSVGLLIYRLHLAAALPKLDIGQGGLAIVLVASFLTPEVPLNPLYEMICIALIYPFIIVSGCQHVPTGTMAQAARISAELSFPLYALHYPFVTWFSKAADHFHLGRTGAGACYLIFMAVAAAAAWSMFPLDNRVRRIIATMFP